MVVSESLAYGLSRMYDGVVYSEKYEINVFNDIDEARQWLGLETDTPAQKRGDLSDRYCKSTPST